MPKQLGPTVMHEVRQAQTEFVGDGFLEKKILQGSSLGHSGGLEEFLEARVRCLQLVRLVKNHCCLCHSLQASTGLVMSLVDILRPGYS